MVGAVILYGIGLPTSPLQRHLGLRKPDSGGALWASFTFNGDEVHGLQRSGALWAMNNGRSEWIQYGSLKSVICNMKFSVWANDNIYCNNEYDDYHTAAN
jgi:hypothetical protein